MAADRFDDQDLQLISFGMMQPTSSSNYASSSIVKEGGTYDMGELDQSLFLCLDEHDQSPVQEHKVETLNIFPSLPMHVHPALIKEDLSLLPSTSSSYKTSDEQSILELGKGKEIKISVKKDADSLDQGPKTPDAKALRRLAQNRVAAKKSRLRKKAYIQQLENSRMKLMHLELELQRTRTQGMLLNGGETKLSSSTNGLSTSAMFDMEHARWKEEHHHLIRELHAAVQEQLSEDELRMHVDKCVAHHDIMMNLKNVMIKHDVFHLISGMWMSQAERCFMWIGGFRPSQLMKIILRYIEPLSEQQLLDICNLQQSTHETEETLSQGLEALHRSLTDTIISDTTIDSRCPSMEMSSYMGPMSIAVSMLRNLEDFARQANNLRHQTIHMLNHVLSTRQGARCFLGIADYFHRLRTLSSLWLQTRSTAI